MWERQKHGSEDHRMTRPPLRKPCLSLAAPWPDLQTVGVIRSCCFSFEASVENLKQGKFCEYVILPHIHLPDPSKPCARPQSFQETFLLWQLQPSPRVPFSGHSVHLMSEQHILISKYILSHVRLLLFFYLGPNSVADFLKVDCAFYLFCIPCGFYHFAADMKVFNTYLKWVELNFESDTHWMERAWMWWGVCGAQSGKRDCTQHFSLKFRCCKTEHEHCKNNICYCSLELDNVVYTSRRIITWAQDAMYWNHLHGKPRALRMWEENDGGSWD